MKYRLIRRALLGIVLAGALAIGLITAPVLATGYHMYREAIEEKPIEDVVEEIQGRESYIPLDQISDDFKEMIIETEDHRFYYHLGFDPIAIARATCYNIKAGAYIQGGSTITQQLSKNLYFDFEKRMERKVAELFMAVQLEVMYTKEEILELYCNVIYFGEGCYGIRDAAMHYYSCTPEKLTKEEADALVYTIKCPAKYNPHARAKQLHEPEQKEETAQKKSWGLLGIMP
ncbi:MAG: glycosyl transferase [Lachnospiraceae bacterium]|nr:glycosyl transferase [Lachnospiraceae bacterium]